jgi:outer membrane protein/protease secretion system outer membrane protein
MFRRIPSGPLEKARKRLLACLMAGLGLASSPAVHAIDLLQSYRLAVENEPAYQAARATAAASREALPQAISQLLPNVQASGSQSRADTTQTFPNAAGQDVSRAYNYLSYNYALTLRQPLFRMQSWANYQQAEARVSGTEADLETALKDLGGRVAEAYFAALLAEDVLASVLVQKEANLAQLNSAKRALALGWGTRTDVDEAQASYDFVLSQELEASQNTGYSKRQLETLINQPVSSLARLDPALMELAPPQPAKLEDWLARAEETNPGIKSLLANLEVARQEVKKASAGHLPTVDMFVQRSVTNSDSEIAINQHYDTSRVGVQVTIPLYSGGYVNSTQRQASANVEQAQQKLDASRRELSLKVRKQFQSVGEGVERIRALEIAKRSAEQAIISTQKGVMAGTRTSLDVLNALQKGATVERDLARARYDYALARIRLFSLTGSDDIEVLSSINRWLAPAS